jgi:uncharacterized protein YbaR (Trm112 family)
MLDPEFLKILRCPFDPRREAALSQPDESKLVCSRCQVTFPIRDGFPILLVDEAQLPPGCSGQDQLACQKGQS